VEILSWQVSTLVGFVRKSEMLRVECGPHKNFKCPLKIKERVKKFVKV
jgi:hypothetical protein